MKAATVFLAVAVCAGMAQAKHKPFVYDHTGTITFVPSSPDISASYVSSHGPNAYAVCYGTDCYASNKPFTGGLMVRLDNGDIGLPYPSIFDHSGHNPLLDMYPTNPTIKDGKVIEPVVQFKYRFISYANDPGGTDPAGATGAFCVPFTLMKHGKPVLKHGQPEQKETCYEVSD